MIEDLIQSKARECEIDRDRFPSLTVFLEDSLSKVLETEFIPIETKKRIINEISNIREKIEKSNLPPKKESEDGLIGSFMFSIMTIAVVLLVFAYLSTYVFGLVGLNSQTIIIAVVIAVVFMIAAALAIMRKSIDTVL